MSEVTTSTQDTLSSTYKSPPSIGLGVAYRKGRTRFHASGEWFDARTRYDIIEPEPAVLPDSSTQVFSLTQEFASVTNVAVGLEHVFAQGLTGYAGFRTDFSAKEAGSADNSSLSVWGIYHLSAGATMKIGKTDLTLGTIFAFGSKLTDTGIVQATRTTGTTAGEPEGAIHQADVHSGILDRILK